MKKVKFPFLWVMENITILKTLPNWPNLIWISVSISQSQFIYIFTDSKKDWGILHMMFLLESLPKVCGAISPPPVIGLRINLLAWSRASSISLMSASSFFLALHASAFPLVSHSSVLYRQDLKNIFLESEIHN